MEKNGNGWMPSLTEYKAIERVVGELRERIADYEGMLRSSSESNLSLVRANGEMRRELETLKSRGLLARVLNRQ